MSAVKHHYIKFYGRDWLGDASLRMCTPEERGVWIDLLCVMAMAEPYGCLAVAGRPMTDEEASRIVGMEIVPFRGILGGLLAKGIPSRDDNGMIYSRRMVKEHHKFVVCRESGRKGGNPFLKKEEEIPEAICQKPEATHGLRVTLKGTLKGQETTQSTIPLEGWSIQQVIEIASYPDCAVTSSMAQSCFDNYAATEWTDKNGNKVGQTINSLKALLRKWKANEASFGKKYEDAQKDETPAEKMARVERQIRGGAR